VVVTTAALLAAVPAAESRALDDGLVARGERIFRFDTFGDEQLWTDQLKLHRVIESTLDPQTALELGLKIDVDALSPAVKRALRRGEVDLTDPAVTVALIKRDAVVGIVGNVVEVRGQNRLRSVGITCALCHSTVDDSFAPGIGRRLDGWPNLDLDPGKIIALEPVRGGHPDGRAGFVLRPPAGDRYRPEARPGGPQAAPPAGVPVQPGDAAPAR
jgi:hypothetical protein